MLTHQCIHELLIQNPYTRSAYTDLLQQPWTHLHTMGDRAFTSAAPQLWNTLPPHLRAHQSINSFKKGLKTLLFRKAFFSLSSMLPVVFFSFLHVVFMPCCEMTTCTLQVCDDELLLSLCTDTQSFQTQSWWKKRWDY